MDTSDIEKRFENRRLGDERKQDSNTSENADIKEYVIEPNPVFSSLSEKQLRYVALYKARKILTLIGTTAEKISAGKMLTKMKKEGLNSL